MKLGEKAELLAHRRRPTPARWRRVSQRAVLHATAVAKGFYKVELEKDRFAFVRTPDAKEVKSGKAARASRTWSCSPRASRRASTWTLDPAAGGLVADGRQVHPLRRGDRHHGPARRLRARERPEGLLQGRARTPRATRAAHLKFTTDFTLKEGNNNVLVVARETPDFASRRTLVIRRRPAAVAQKVAAPTPAHGAGQGAVGLAPTFCGGTRAALAGALPPVEAARRFIDAFGAHTLASAELSSRRPLAGARPRGGCDDAQSQSVCGPRCPAVRGHRARGRLRLPGLEAGQPHARRRELQRGRQRELPGLRAAPSARPSPR